MYDHLYDLALYFYRMFCAYCDEPFYCYDHCPAITRCSTIDKKLFKDLGFNFIKFPSCKNCNELLGNKHLITYSERLELLIDALDKSLDKVEIWTEKELSEMGRGMRDYIVSKQHQNNINVRRLHAMQENMERVFSGEIIDSMLIHNKEKVDRMILEGLITTDLEEDSS